NGDSVFLQWMSGVDVEQTLIEYRIDSTSEWTFVTELDGITTQFLHTGITSNGSSFLEYRLRFANAAGESAFSTTGYASITPYAVLFTDEFEEVPTAPTWLSRSSFTWIDSND